MSTESRANRNIRRIAREVFAEEVVAVIAQARAEIEGRKESEETMSELMEEFEKRWRFVLSGDSPCSMRCVDCRKNATWLRTTIETLERERDESERARLILARIAFSGGATVEQLMADSLEEARAEKLRTSEETP